MILAFDFETSYEYSMGYDKRAYPVLLCMLSDTGIKKHWLFVHDQNESIIPSDVLKQEIQSYVDKATLLVASNIKFDLHWLRRLGIDFSKQKLFCTQIAEYLINGENNRVRYSLEETSKRYGIPEKIDRVKMWWDSGYETCQIPLDTLIPYCYQDTANSLAIAQKQQIKLEQMNLTKLASLSFEIARICQDIEWNGMLIDKQKCEDYSAKYAIQIDNLYSELNLFVRDNISEFSDLPLTDTQGKALPNFGSGEQLSAILFGGEFKYKGRIDGKREGTTKNGTVVLRVAGLGFVPRDGTETASDGYYSVDKAQFDGLKPKGKAQREFLKKLTELSLLEKMRGTYFLGLLRQEQEDIVHCNINQTVTVTGRFSSTQPNLQNIPRGTTSPIKEVFISRYKGG